jgi:Flp pilus assembly protein TadD
MSMLHGAYADRAEAYFERKNYSSAIPDYDHAIALSPKDAALWNDRAMAKEETRDKSGAVRLHAVDSPEEGHRRLPPFSGLPRP